MRVSLSPLHIASSGCGWRNDLLYGANILNKQSRTTDEGWSSPCVLGEVLKPPVLKILLCYETIRKASDQVRLNLSGYGQAAGSCGCGNEPSDPVQCWEIFY
jgi:hypothetical protein